MRIDLDRAIITVVRDGDGWAVEHEGEHFGHSADKEIAKACANKRAREIHDGGRACQVRISGEYSMLGAR